MFPALKGILFFVVAVTPGVFGETLYSKYVGKSATEDRLRRVTRTIIISAGGLILLMVTELFLNDIGIPVTLDPMHLAPGRYPEGFSMEGFEKEIDVAIIGAYAAHAVSATVVGGIIAVGWDHLASRFNDFSYPNAWDSVTDQARGRWVVVSTEGRKSFLGVIDTVDTNVPRNSRDILLEEPAQYNEDHGVYVAMAFKSLFIRSELITSVSVLYDPAEDERVTKVGEVVYSPSHSRPPNNGTENYGKL
jgi:hypothetical protein